MIPAKPKTPDALTPRQIVGELDKYIVGQDDAKRAVAIALRNRWRRRQVNPDLQDEIVPKNIILIGSTGVGKTEIARRLAKLAEAPFVKVEASKFTEVGYVGRDVDSMIRDLVEGAVQLVRKEEEERVYDKAVKAAEERLLDLLVPPPPPQPEPRFDPWSSDDDDEDPNRTVIEPQKPAAPDPEVLASKTREKFREKLRKGELDDRKVTIEAERQSMPMFEIFSASGMEEISMQMKDMLSNVMPSKKQKRKVRVGDAREQLIKEESAKLVDQEGIQREALKRAETAGIVFLDELDKIAGGGAGSHGPDVSREGVQRDILPIVEGSTVATKYGPVNTDHILFIAAGAFHVSKPSDLIPELQGRFPIRVELNTLTKEDFVRILTEPENSLVRQYRELMATEGVTIDFTEESILRIAEIAAQANASAENIGARRLHTVVERLLEEVMFEAPEAGKISVNVTPEYVNERLKDVLQNEDLSRYIL